MMQNVKPGGVARRMAVWLCLLMWLWRTPANAGEYLFEAFFCEVGESSVGEQTWTIPSGLIGPITTFVDQDTAAALMETYADSVVRFPVLRLNVGERASANRQAPFRYAAQFDEQGEATHYEEIGVGTRVEAELIEVQPNRVTVQFAIEENWLEAWLPYTRDNVETQMPAFASRSWDTELTFIPGEWLWIGGVTREQSDEKRYRITLIRVRPSEIPYE